jgi:hypothetical protein
MSGGADTRHLDRGLQPDFRTTLALSQSTHIYVARPLTTLTESIMAHGAQGRVSRDRFAALPTDQQAEIVEFLKTLQVLPESAAALTIDTLGRPVDKAALAKRFGR